MGNENRAEGQRAHRVESQKLGERRINLSAYDWVYCNADLYEAVKGQAQALWVFPGQLRPLSLRFRTANDGEA